MGLLNNTKIGIRIALVAGLPLLGLAAFGTEIIIEKWLERVGIETPYRYGADDQCTRS